MIAKIILIITNLIQLGIYIGKHGKTQKKEYNAWHYFIAIMVLFTLYYYAGIFNF